MLRRLDIKWLTVSMECAGAVCTAAFVTDATIKFRAAHNTVTAISDAAGDGEGTPGIDEYLHGYHWRVPLTPTLLPILHITAWEAVAVAVTIPVAARLVGLQAILSMRSDALLTPLHVSETEVNQRAEQCRR